MKKYILKFLVEHEDGKSVEVVECDNWSEEALMGMFLISCWNDNNDECITYPETSLIRIRQSFGFIEERDVMVHRLDNDQKTSEKGYN